MNDDKLLIEQVRNIIDKDLPLVSNLSNVSAIINRLDNLNWCGFYLVDGDTLYLGPFQGEIACTRIPKGKGVCGTAFEKKSTIIVDDVNQFPGHIACSSLSKSEIVVPVIKDNQVKAIIDVDSPIYSRFSKNEQLLLEQIAEFIKDLF